MSPGNTTAARTGEEPPQPGRKSSSTVLIGAIGALSLAVAGCSTPAKEVTAHCVEDGNKGRPTPGASPDPWGTPAPGPTAAADGGGRDGQRVVDERHCKRSGGSSGVGSGYHYYYGGTVDNGRVSGGTTTRPSDAKVVTERGTVIQRGGAGGRGGSGWGG
ncbi:hypothetical protein HNR23_000019 [Nocardiopsis mwathae]|uniref:Uncharacterized protein n=1 Tax=Nocardiopsis mwathae TaxID=1472723 RepID=A0A7W9YD54_9ACTN|nr:hypothetical protein [Nocardiopsis mwathae]MBB6169959.1 hypothetical protein [Nocardiopsis mwathae]